MRRALPAVLVAAGLLAACAGFEGFSRSPATDEQRLVFAAATAAVESDPVVSEALSQASEVLLDLGFEFDRFGDDDTWRLSKVPSIGRKSWNSEEVERLVEDMLAEGRPASLQGWRAHVLGVMACHGSIRAGESLNMDQMTRLLETMRTLKNPFNCVHGRPTAVTFTTTELERRFRRTV